MDKRIDGFYKVKRNGRWIIAEWLDLITLSPCWFLTGNETMFYDSDFEEIEETPILSANGLDKHKIEFTIGILKQIEDYELWGDDHGDNLALLYRFIENQRNELEKLIK